ncbi:uncharacterized protein RJT20DRAFT_136950 [Scheffersomyces xylosifermentans]|uniref:uncharacterized protein n=1 Tax=Scheffersomyces xylosifermentans TaxID=1304137 RepID=UPI00315D21A3
MRRLRRTFTNPFILMGIVLFLLLISQIVTYDEGGISTNFTAALHQGTYFWTRKKQITTNQLVFPKSLEISNLDNFVDKNPLFFNRVNLGRAKLVQAEDEDSSASQIHLEYFPHNVTIYNSRSNIDLDLDKCDTIREDIQIHIDEVENLDISLVSILRDLVRDIEKGNNPYYEELAPFFLSELKLQLKHNVAEKYWYRLAGSSVWLEEYGVHYMISRVLFSPKGVRSQPVVSLTYAQLYDKDWNELVNTKLVVPSNSMRKIVPEGEVVPDPNVGAGLMPPPPVKTTQREKQQFKVLKFPSFLPIPFWHDYDVTQGKYYGPEDPRIILVNNKRGYKEPLIIFNAYHRKLDHFDDDFDDRLVMKVRYYRSMFICWPWQFQRGKENMDGIPNPEYDDRFYNRVTELQFKNLPRLNAQKNWTPFISESERRKHSAGSYFYDTHLNFIYRWANLEVLRCSLSSGICGFSYRLNDRLAPSASVGPLRGGTQLININELLGGTQEPQLIAKMIPPNREIWLGFARAHLDKCGCGNTMYRPNLVVLVKDRVEVAPGPSLFGGGALKPIAKDFYKISHISSSISFDIPIIGWDLMNPKVLCTRANILMPNGISSWTLNSVGRNGTHHWTADDYLTLSLSISDFTVHKVNVKGLLNEIFKLADKSLFLTPSDNEVKSLPDKVKQKLQIPDPRDLDDSAARSGFNNDNVVCAMLSSTEFCSKYGHEQGQNFLENHNIYKDFVFVHHEDEVFDKSEFDRYEEDLEEEKMNDYRKKYFSLYGSSIPTGRPTTYDYDDKFAIPEEDLKLPKKKAIVTSESVQDFKDVPLKKGQPKDVVVSNLELNGKEIDDYVTEDIKPEPKKKKPKKPAAKIKNPEVQSDDQKTEEEPSNEK